MPQSKIFFDLSKFPDNQFFMLSEKLNTLTQKQAEALSFYNFKNPNVTAVAGVFLGFFGVDRFYIEDTMQGIIKAVASFFFLIISLPPLLEILNATFATNIKISSKTKFGLKFCRIIKFDPKF
jgi:TM2 domain